MSRAGLSCPAPAPRTRTVRTARYGRSAVWARPDLVPDGDEGDRLQGTRNRITVADVDVLQRDFQVILDL